VIARPSRETLAQVLNGEMDMGVGFFRKVPRGIVKRKILDTDISLVIPRGHQLRRKRQFSLRDVVKHRIIMRRRLSPTRHVIDMAFSDSATDPNRILEVGRCQSAMDFVELGLGVGFVHSICACAEPHDKLEYISMSRFFGNMEVSLITRSNAVLSPAHHALMTVFLENTHREYRAKLERRNAV
jgi:DNA-binding transcriptional LysR family regulator